MEKTKDKTSLYFQTIAGFFFEQRGSPFFLSSKELDVIAGWEEMKIPVQVVLEGIRDCIAYHRRRPGRRNKIHSLVFCRSFVLRAFEAYKERKVGNGRKSSREMDKKIKLKKAVERFLNSCPEEIRDISEIFSRVKEMLSREVDEENLETLEQQLERFLVEKTSDSVKERIRKEVITEYEDRKGQEHIRILELKIIKYMREKYKIPHISLYYY